MLRLKHSPRPRPVRRVPFSHLVKAGFFAVGLPRNTFCAFDVTARCNLRCKHCYFFEQEHGPELSLVQWEDLMYRLQKQAWPRPYFAFQCSWVGGEPLLRQEVIERCKGFFPYNIVVTNGTLPLPAWPDVHFFISVDGTKQAHDAIRGAGTYDKIVAHAARPELDVMITCCINRLNAHCVEELVQEWDARSVNHVAFEFHTPIQGLADDHQLALELEQRDNLLQTLTELKMVYGQFILSPARTYRLMHSSRCRQVTDDCLYRSVAPVFGPDGQRKRPCMLGPKADCDRCGCLIPFVTRAQVDRKEIVRDLWRGGLRRLRRGL